MRGYLVVPLVLLSLVPSAGLARDSADLPARSQKESDLVITVWCRDGAFYRGEPIEYVPNDHLTLRLVDGKNLRIAWDNVSSVEGMPNKAARPKGDEPAKRPMPPTSRPAPAAPVPAVEEPAFDAFATPRRAASPQPRTPQFQPGPSPEVVVNMPLLPGNSPVQVRFTGMRQGAMIEYLASSAELNGWSWPAGYVSGSVDTWKEICALPCRLNADRDKSLRIYGPDITPSKAFLLPTRGERFEVEIKPGWHSTRIAAWAVMGVGIGIGVVGSIVAGLTDTTWAEPGPRNFLIAGGALMGAGLVITLASIPVFIKSRTDIEVYRE